MEHSCRQRDKMTIDKKSDYSSKKLLVVSLLVVLVFVDFRKTDATSCILRNKQIGECTQIRDCRSAILKLRRGDGSPEYCNVEDESVCCPDYVKETKVPYQNEQIPQISQVSQSKLSSQAPQPHLCDSNRTCEEKEVSEILATENRATFEGIEQFEKFERVPNNAFSEESPDLRDKRNPDDRFGGSFFVPPGLAKKKPWIDGNNEYFYEFVTKKPNHVHGQGQGHKGPNKHQPFGWGPDSTTIRPDWYHQNERVTNYPGNWYNGQSQIINHNQRTTTKRHYQKWSQETTTPRNQYTENRPDGNSYWNTYTENSNSNVWFQKTTTQAPNFLFSQHGSRPQENRPNGGSTPHRKLRISELKCLEYSKEVIENVTGLPLTTDPNPVIIPVRKCVQAQQLIVGGENTTLGEFPHMAAIGFRNRNNNGISWNCGGTLISEQFVLTAAHCTSTSSGRPVKVRLGEYNLMKNDDGAHPVDYGISEIINYPEYKPPSKYHDIALLKLSRRVKFYKHIRPACLYLDDTFSLTKAVATGWGRMFYDGSVSEVLQKVVLSIVDNNTCNRLYKVNVKTEVLSRGIVDSQLCAGELSGGKDTCQGDSGGPLSITNTKCIHHIVGITSFGKSCALPNSTGVYTKVPAYIPWIESIVWPQG